MLALTLPFFNCAGDGNAPGLAPLPAIESATFQDAVTQEAERLLSQIRKEPKSESANGELGMLLHAHEQLAGASVLYDRAASIGASSYQWPYLRAVATASQGAYEDALRLFDQSLALANKQGVDSFPVLVRRAETLTLAGRDDEAEQIFRELLTRNEKHPRVNYGLGRVLAARGETEAAIGRLQDSVEVFPSYGAAHYALALAFRKQGERQAAERELLLSEQNRLYEPPLDDPWMRRVLQKNKTAVYQLRQAVELATAGRLQDAANANLEALKLDPSQMQAHVNLISLYGRLGKVDEAKKHYQAVSTGGTDSAEAYYNYGVLLFSQGKAGEAEREFRKALRVNPYYTKAQNNLAFLLEQQGQPSEAIQLFREAVKNDPRYRLAHYHLGRMLAQRGQFREAVTHLQASLSPVDQDTAGYQYGLSMALLGAGRKTQAKKNGEQALELAKQYGQTQLAQNIERFLGSL
jgi:tetratricopeptide (TPR) repeat protein